MLITLAIIGVVAALTIPTVIANYQKKQFYTAFMKTYNALTTALNLSAVQNGTPNNWVYNGTNDTIRTLNEYIYPYLKIAKTCEEAEAAECLSYDILPLSMNQAQKGPASQVFFQYGPSVVFLNDGTVISTGFEGGAGSSVEGVFFLFDINGAKGPNVAGRDIFWLEYLSDEKGKWYFPTDVDFPPENCDPSSNNPQAGLSCSSRLIIEGKMDY